jgi:FixJ family two-component response regulator
MPSAIPIVFIVDDDVSVRESLELLVRDENWKPQTFASAQEFLNHPRKRVPSCLVLDLSLPGVDGLELQKRLGVEDIEMPIIFITGHGDVPQSVQAMKAGALEFLTKPVNNEALVSAIRNAIQRSSIALAQNAEMQELRDRYASLTTRERQVMELVVAGLLNKQVGGELGISEITVKAHRGQAMQKMKANSLADLVRMAGKLRPASPAIHTGIGLPPNQAGQIFNAFFTTKEHGTGMGLRISRTIIEAHGGRLWATDNHPRGASFHFTLAVSSDAASLEAD